MPSTCERCGRGSRPSTSRSHSNIATKRRQHLNLQKVAFGGSSQYLCSSCVRNERHTLANLAS